MENSFRIGHLLLRGLGFAFSAMLFVCHLAILIAFKLVDFVADSF